jgi:AcrR family transcriptional regulator
VPKVVDHEQRRHEVVEALWRVIVSQGIERVSTRSVSAETGWSRGVVDYYFSDMDELLLVGLRRALEVDISARELTSGQQGAAALRAVLLMSMPLDDERRRRAKVWLSYLGRAVSGGAIGAEFARCARVRADMYAALLGDMIDRGELAKDHDPQAEAARILAFELSANVSEMLDPGQTPPELLAADVDRFIDRLLAGRVGDGPGG